MKIENLKQRVKEFVICNAKFAFCTDPQVMGDVG
jgi:hypothetical protein